MALADALSSMSSKAKEVEAGFHKAKDAQRAKLEEQIARAKTSAEGSRAALRTRADDTKSDVSSGWRDLQKNWDRHTQDIRTHVSEKREEHDVKFAAKKADVAEADAEFAVAIAEAAIEEADYASLEAVNARAKANELAAARES